MKKTLLFVVACCLSAVISQAQIVIGTVGNGNFVNWSGYSYETYGLDFNNDGNLEFALSNAESEVSAANCMLQWSWSEGGTNVWTAGSLESGAWDEVNELTEGTAISASANWQGQGDATLVSFYDGLIVPLNQDFYVGFRIKLNNNTHYGWAKVEVTGNATNGYEAQWKQIAYNATPNAAISAGQTTGIETLVADVKIYPNPTTSILKVESEIEMTTATIYNICGQQCLFNPIVDNTIDVSALAEGTYTMVLSNGNQTISYKFIKK